jgi:hypothetical protein
MILHRHLLTIALLLMLQVTVASADDKQPAITIERVQWGFDGKAPERTFTPLSVLVQNNTPLEFEGTLTLTKLIQSTKPIDAAVERDIYVGPLSSRWVQFVPYVISDWEQWRLSWGKAADQRYDVPTPQIGEPATVLLYDPEDLQFAGGVLRRFEVNLFPASVTGTDALRGVVMDRPPRWQGARRQAFLDWLQRGGKVFLLQDEQGRFPPFPESLSRLNGGGDRFSVGAGTVQRIARSVNELTPEFVKEQILTDRASGVPDERYQQYRRSPQYPGTAPLINRSGWDRDTQMFIDLQTITRFARRWWVIYILSLTYLFVVLPIVFRIGQEARDYRWVYVALLLSVGLFSYGFASLGKLGASEVNRARSVAVAQQLNEGVYDLTQWTCVGVRAGGEYTVGYGGTGQLYTTSQDMERIDGTIVAGPGGRMDLEIPPASTRTVLSRRRVQAQPLGLRVRMSSIDEQGLSALTMETGPEFPADPMIMLAAHGGRMYQLQQVGELLTLVPSSRRPLVSFLTEHLQMTQFMGLRAGMMTNRPDDSQPADTKVYEVAMRTLVGNSFGLRERVDLTKLQLPAGLVRVFVYAPQPRELQASGGSFPDTRGYVLYCVDLPLAGAATPADSPPDAAANLP